MMKARIFSLYALALSVLVGCDKQVEQTVVVRADIANATTESLWLTEADNCSAQRLTAGWYRDGLWIFKLSSTRGAVGAVTQELAVCTNVPNVTTTPMWHSVHGGGAPLLVLSCVPNEKAPCRMYQDGYTKGAWSEESGQ